MWLSQRLHKNRKTVGTTYFMIIRKNILAHQESSGLLKLDRVANILLNDGVSEA